MRLTDFLSESLKCSCDTSFLRREEAGVLAFNHRHFLLPGLRAFAEKDAFLRMVNVECPVELF